MFRYKKAKPSFSYYSRLKSCHFKSFMVIPVTSFSWTGLIPIVFFPRPRIRLFAYRKWDTRNVLAYSITTTMSGYSTEVGDPTEDGTLEGDDLAIWIEKVGGIKKNRILGFPGYRARDVLGTPPIVPPSIGYSSPQQSIDPKELENMIDKIVLRRLGIKSMDDASTNDSTPQPSIGIDITEHITILVEKNFTNFLQTFINYDLLEEELYRPNLDFLEENDDEVDLT